MNIPQWSKQEKQIARAAFDKAIERECAQLVASFRQRAADIKNMDDLWSIREELNRLWRELPEKYDYRYSQLTWVFARLIHEHWMTLDDLKGLGEDKLEPIRRALAFANQA